MDCFSDASVVYTQEEIRPSGSEDVFVECFLLYSKLSKINDQKLFAQAEEPTLATVLWACFSYNETQQNTQRDFFVLAIW